MTYNFFGRSLWRFEKDGEPFSVLVGGRLSADESVFLAQAALNGAGIAMQPYLSVKKYLESGSCSAITRLCAAAIRIYAVYASRQNMPTTLRAVLDF